MTMPFPSFDHPADPRSLVELTSVYPDLTISDVRSALPHTRSFMDRASEGLETAGMRL
jgi:hypothetical protein